MPKRRLQILFTSGTTGDPKGIVLTHGNVLASMGPIEKASQPYLRYVRLVHPLRILHTLPLSHVFGQTMGLWIPPIYAAELHFESRLVASRLVETIRRERISVLAAVPRVLALLKTHLESTLPGLAGRAAGPLGKATGVPVPLRWWRFRDVHAALGLKFWAIISGGGALPASIEKFWNAVGLVVVQGYGMTETTALITLNHPFHVAQGTIGKPLAGREVKLGPDGEVLVRGAAISSATWSGGALQPRANEWLATGDLAESAPSGELRFLGRKSEVIVTAAGLNLHPEDLEAAVEQRRGVAACAVVPMETPTGPEPCAVLAFRGSGAQAEAVMEQANARLAEFQQMRRWVLWPEPDLPRTSTGKVRRKAVAEWLSRIQAANGNGSALHNGKNGAGNNGHGTNGNGSKPHASKTFGASSDWLLHLIAQVSGEMPPGVGDELRIAEDLHLDSLGRVQLAAAIEERTGISLESHNGSFDRAQTLGDLRRLLDTEPKSRENSETKNVHKPSRPTLQSSPARPPVPGPSTSVPPLDAQNSEETGAPSPIKSASENLYPRWPWWFPVRWARTAFLEAVLRPLVWLLAKPRVVTGAPQDLAASAPMLIVANHVTAFDGPLIEYALPPSIRRRMAVAMSGEMLSAYRRFRNLQPAVPTGRFFSRPALLLPCHRAFQRLPAAPPAQLPAQLRPRRPGTRSRIQRHDLPRGRPLARRADGQLPPRNRPPRQAIQRAGSSRGPARPRRAACNRPRWFRSGQIEIRLGQPIHFGPLDSEAAITARLEAEVRKAAGTRCAVH